MPRLFFSSCNGCYANKAEGELICEFFLENGYELVQEPNAADLLVCNTCAFDRRSEDRSLTTVSELQRAARPGAEVLVTGCLPGINPGRLKGQLEGRTVTPQTLGDLDRMFNASVSLGEIQKRFSPQEKKCLIKVATGCLGSCTFCGTKNAIGRLRSRSIPEILAEFDMQYARGHRRFVFASHDFGAYGRDIRTDAVTLLQETASRPGDFKIEIEWVDPRWLYLMLDGFIEVLQTGKMAKYFYLSLQSASPRILRLMRRQYTAQQVRHCLRRLTNEVTDFRPQIEFIVGFPTETEEDFQDTLRLVQEFIFLDVTVYKFDPKPGTAAALMDDQISEEIKERRFQEAQAVAEQNRLFLAVAQDRECLLRARLTDSQEPPQPSI